MSVDNKAVHLLAGGLAGTLGSVLTCPLDVAKTRLQSSLIDTYRSLPDAAKAVGQFQPPHKHLGNARFLSTIPRPIAGQDSVGFYRCIKHIVRTEGPRALFKGLGPTLIGVAPSRATYFCTYAHCKQTLNQALAPTNNLERSFVHLCSAATAGFVSTTASNPIWVIKTRLQLDNKKGTSLTAFQCVRRIHAKEGLRGFYKGLTASYFGISETVIHFVIYETLKSMLTERRLLHDPDRAQNRRATDFVEFMAAAATSKTIATCIAYPHEVARTRMREEGTRYTKFWKTLQTVASEEGTRGLYRGLTTQLIKHIPTTAIVMCTYEAVVYLSYKNGF